MIVDAHCHAGLGTRLTGPWDTSARLGRYLRRAERAGIERTALIPAFHEDYRIANRDLARIVGSQPERFVGFAMVHPRRDRGRIGDLVREAVEDFGFRGIKVHRQDAHISREVCEVARRFSLPILYDVMGETAIVELIAPEYPDVAFIVPHLGSFGDDWRAHVALIDQMSRHPNVYADTSGVRRFDYLVQAVKRGGSHRVLFGSDEPWFHPGLELAKIRLLGLPRSDRTKVEGANAAALLGLGSRASQTVLDFRHRDPSRRIIRSSAESPGSFGPVTGSPL
jgi:uncharacterized protein